MQKLGRYLYLLCILCSFSLFLACEPKPISQLSPEDGIVRLRSYHQDKNWERVIGDVSEYRSRYPYSQFADEADLMQADAFFRSNQYAEAVVAYDDFAKKKPNHPQTPLANYRVALAYDAQSPEEIDREQLFSLKAIEKFNEFISKYPASEWRDNSKIRLAILQRRVAENHQFVARFYWKKDMYNGALIRYKKIIEEFNMFNDLLAEAKERIPILYNKLADELAKDPKSDAVIAYKNSTPESLRKLAAEFEARQKK